jgi:hypothetical protein
VPKIISQKSMPSFLPPKLIHAKLSLSFRIPSHIHSLLWKWSITSKEKQYVYLSSSDSGKKHLESARITICGIKKSLITTSTFF